eukprot:scaffold79122_cov31-Prasinocladus_malaysianus.AAC.2
MNSYEYEYSTIFEPRVRILVLTSDGVKYGVHCTVVGAPTVRVATTCSATGDRLSGLRISGFGIWPFIFGGKIEKLAHRPGVRSPQPRFSFVRIGTHTHSRLKTFFCLLLPYPYVLMAAAL